MAERDIKVTLSVRDDGSVVLKGFGDNVGKLEGKTSQSTASMGAAWAALRTTLISVVAAAGVVTGALAKAAREAAGQELAEAKLANIVKRVNGEGDEQVKMLTDLASALQETTKFGDEQIINSQALLGTFKLNSDAIALLSPRLLDMATALEGVTGESVDLKGVTIAVGKAFTDGIGALKRYGVTMTDAEQDAFNLGNTQERVAVLTKILDGNFRGLAEAAGKTFSGQLGKLKNAWGELLEALGDAVVKNADVRALFVSLIDKIKEWTAKLRENGPEIREFVSNLVSAARAIASVVASIASFVSENGRLIASLIALKVISSIIVLLSGLSSAAAGAAAALRLILAALGGPIGLAVGAVVVAVTGLTNRLREAREAAIDFARTKDLLRIDPATLGNEALTQHRQELEQLRDRAKEAATEQRGFVAWLISGDNAQEQATENLALAERALARYNAEQKQRTAVAEAAAKAGKKAAEAAALEADALNKLKSNLDAVGKRYDQLAQAAQQFAASQITIAEALSEQRLSTIATDILSQKALVTPVTFKLDDSLKLIEFEKEDFSRKIEAIDKQASRRTADEKRRLAAEVLAIERASLDQQLNLVAELENSQIAQASKTIGNLKQRATVINEIEIAAAGKKVDIYTRAQAAIERRIGQSVQAEIGYANQVIALAKQIEDAKASTEERIFRLKLSQLSSFEKIAALEARASSLSGQAAEQAWVEFAQAGGSVEKALEKITEEGQRTVDGLKLQNEEAQKNLDLQKQTTAALQAQYAALSGKLAELVAQRNELEKSTESTHLIKIDDTTARAAIEDLKKPTSSVHTINVQTVEQRRHGGAVGLARGGKLGGYGGGDKVRALLEPGEFVMRKESVRKYGQGLFDLLNGLRIPDSFALPKFAQGGPVSPSPVSDRGFGTLKFDVGGRQVAVKTSRAGALELSDSFNRLARQGRGVRRI